MPLDRNTVSDCGEHVFVYNVSSFSIYFITYFTDINISHDKLYINFNRGALVDLHLSPCLMPRNMSLPLKQ